MSVDLANARARKLVGVNTPRGRLIATVAASAAIALLAYVALHIRGIGLDPDAWGYWQGAVSLAEGRGYTYFSGNPIIAWPPLYSIYLSLWVLLVGPTGLGVVLANGFLVTAQAALWTYVHVTIWQKYRDTLPAVALVTAALYIGLFVAITQQSARAQSLGYTLLPIIYLLTWRLTAPEGAKSHFTVSVVLLGLVAAGALLTHNATAAFVGSSGLIIAWYNRRRWTIIASAGVAILIAMILWHLARLYLGQADLRPVGIGAGDQDALSYLAQIVQNTGSLILPDMMGMSLLIIFVGVGFVIVMLSLHRDCRPLWIGASFASLSALLTYVLFNISYVPTDLGPRFLSFLPLLIIPLLIFIASSHHQKALVAILLIVVAPLLYRAGTWIHWTSTASNEERGFPEGFVTHNTRVSPDYPEGPPVHTREGVLVAPIDWEEGYSRPYPGAPTR